MYKRLNIAICMIVLVCTFSMVSCDSDAQEQYEQADQLQPLDIQQLNTILRIKGTTQNGNYKIKVPQNDLNISVEGVKIIPPMGATSWVAFTPAPKGARIMGDMVIKEEEVGAVEQELFKQGLHVTALHKHFEGESPRVMFMHIGGTGSQETLAKSVRAVLDKIESLRGGDPSKAPSVSVTNSLDTEAITEIIGHDGSVTDGVFKIAIGRPDIDLDIYSGERYEEHEEHEEYGEEHEEHEEYEERGEEYEEHEEGEEYEESGEEYEEHQGEHHENEENEPGHVHVTAFTGFNTWAAFQGTPDKAAVAGDFAMLADEVPAVMSTLVENGFKVVSLHNHMIDEHPRIFFLHFWGTGNAQDLAKGLREALDHTGDTKEGEYEE